MLVGFIREIYVYINGESRKYNLKGEKRKGNERKKRKKKSVRRTYIKKTERNGMGNKVLRIYRFYWASSGNNTGKPSFLYLSSEAQASVWLKCYILGSKGGLGLDSGNLYYGLKPGVSRPADNRIGNWIRYRVPPGVVSFLLDPVVLLVHQP